MRWRSIAAKNHKNGVGNPYAQIRKDLGYEFCRTESEKNPRVAGPLKRTDCSLVSDGAAAWCSPTSRPRSSWKGDRVPRRRARAGFFADVAARHPQIRGLRGGLAAGAGGGRDRAARSFLRRGARLLHHRRTDRIRSDGARAGRPGRTRHRRRIVAKDGALPINPSGGLKAKGHPIGATGVSMHAITAMQLTGTAGDMQVKNARLGGIFNMGGAAVANYVSILERLR